MTENNLSPYLTLNGNCREVMTFYHGIFGGELTFNTFEESGFADPPEYKDKIVHASLISNGIHIMASDNMPGQDAAFGTNVSLCIWSSDSDLLTRYFNQLGDGATVTMPLEKQFWGDVSGMLTDKYGLHWMINISAET